MKHFKQYKTVLLLILFSIGIISCDKSDDADQIGWSVGKAVEDSAINKVLIESWGLGKLLSPNAANDFTPGEFYRFDFKIKFDNQIDLPTPDITRADLFNIQTLLPINAEAFNATDPIIIGEQDRFTKSVVPFTQMDGSIFVQTISFAPENETLSYSLLFDLNNIEGAEESPIYKLYLLSKKTEGELIAPIGKEGVTQVLNLEPFLKEAAKIAIERDTIACKLYYLSSIKHDKETDQFIPIFNAAQKVINIPLNRK